MAVLLQFWGNCAQTRTAVLFEVLTLLLLVYFKLRAASGRSLVVPKNFLLYDWQSNFSFIYGLTGMESNATP